MALDNILFTSYKNIGCEYSLEAPWWVASNKYMYPQHVFVWRNKEHVTNFWFKKMPYPKLYIYSRSLFGKAIGV